MHRDALRVRAAPNTRWRLSSTCRCRRRRRRPRAWSRESACCGWPTLLCNAHGVCERRRVRLRGRLRRCELHAAAVVSGMAPRRAATLAPPALRRRRRAAPSCACDGDAIDFAVLRENKTARIPRRLPPIPPPTITTGRSTSRTLPHAHTPRRRRRRRPTTSTVRPHRLHRWLGAAPLAMAGFPRGCAVGGGALGRRRRWCGCPRSHRHAASSARGSAPSRMTRVPPPSHPPTAATPARRAVCAVGAAVRRRRRGAAQLSLLANAALSLWWEDWTSEVGNPSDWRRYVGLCAASLLALAPLQPLLSALFRRANDAYLRTHSSLSRSSSPPTATCSRRTRAKDSSTTSDARARRRRRPPPPPPLLRPRRRRDRAGRWRRTGGWR